MIRLSLALALIAAPVAAEELPRPTAPFSSAFLCQSPSAIDGDTAICGDGTRVRLWGIAAPEKSEPGGPDATNALAALLAGRTLACLPMGTSFNRIVARCWRLEADVGREMVLRGHAMPERKFSNDFYGADPAK